VELVEGREEVLSRLGFGRGECDDRGLAVGKNVDTGQTRGPFDDVEG
jgi:hypothetical protein